MNPPTYIARHEAAHAVVATYFGLPIREITIVPRVIEGREVGGCVLLGEVEGTREFTQAAVATSAARANAYGHYQVGEIPEHTYGTDEKVLRQIAERERIPDDKYEEWRAIMQESASKLVSVVYISEAIDMVAYELDKHTAIAPDVVESISLLCKGSCGVAVQEPEPTDALVERLQRIWA